MGGVADSTASGLRHLVGRPSPLSPMFKSIRYHVRSLTPGASLTVPAGEISDNTIRNYAAAAGTAVGGKFSVHYDRTAGTYTITRTA